MTKKLLVCLTVLLALLAVTTGALAVTTLSFMGWEASPLETQAVENGIAKFEELYPDIKVEYTPGLSGTEYVAKLLSTVAGNTTPDVFFIAAEDYRTFAEKGVLANITDRFSDEYSLDDFLPGVRDIMQIDGQVYGIQSCIVAPVIYYNKDVFDAAGIPYPSSTEAMTYEEFRDLAKQLTVRDGDSVTMYGCYGLEQEWLTTYAFMLSNGVAPFTDDYWTSTFASDETAEVIEWIRDIRLVDGSAPSATTLENIGMSAAQMLQTGKVAMIITGTWAMQELAQMDFPVGTAPLPKFDEALTVSWAHLHAISAASPHQEEAWLFLQFLSGMDYQGALVADGLWLPNRISMYSDEAVAQWWSEDILGTEYLDMLDYFINSRVNPSALQKTNKCGTILNEEMQLYYEGEQDTQTTMTNIDERTNEALADLKD